MMVSGCIEADKKYSASGVLHRIFLGGGCPRPQNSYNRECLDGVVG